MSFVFGIYSNRLPDSVEYWRTSSAIGWASTTTLEVIKYPRKPVGWFFFRHRPKWLAEVGKRKLREVNQTLPFDVLAGYPLPSCGI